MFCPKQQQNIFFSLPPIRWCGGPSPAQILGGAAGPSLQQLLYQTHLNTDQQDDDDDRMHILLFKVLRTSDLLKDVIPGCGVCGCVCRVQLLISCPSIKTRSYCYSAFNFLESYSTFFLQCCSSSTQKKEREEDILLTTNTNKGEKAQILRI